METIASSYGRKHQGSYVKTDYTVWAVLLYKLQIFISEYTVISVSYNMINKRSFMDIVKQKFAYNRAKVHYA